MLLTQDHIGNDGNQFKNAIHLHIGSGTIGSTIFDKLWKADPTALQDILGADLVVFYCSYGQARSPSAMTSYLALRQTLRSAKAHRPDRSQKVVLLDGGIAAFKKLKDITKNRMFINMSLSHTYTDP
jgi:hypothetical protein